MNNILTKVWVKRHNNLVRAHQKNTMSLTAQKLLLFAFTVKDQDLDKVLEFRVADFLGRNPGGKDIKNIDQACDELSSSKIREGSGINDADYESDEFNRKYITLFDTIELNKTRVAFKFNRTFKKFLGPANNYTQYLFSNLKDMRSPHAVRLYDYLIGGVGKYSERRVELQELKAVLGVADKKSYNVFNTFKNTVLEQAVKSINQTSDIHLAYQPLRMSGRKYTHIYFTFSKKQEIAKVEASNDMGLSPENAAKIASMKEMNLPEAIIQATVKELLSQQKSAPIDITEVEVVTEQEKTSSNIAGAGQQDLFSQNTAQPTGDDFEEKLHRLQIRLKEIGLTQAVIKVAVVKYKKNPSLKIWGEINKVKMAMRDNAQFPNKHTLKKWIEEAA
ncbi:MULTISPECIES: replication initiation protein [Flammeovirga]|uniref:Replication initiation protein n=1 Tax=Flammeovirga agarivorans TaxID=2726742 RepID=A0A7X8SN57_9BACT|nr:MULTISPECIES: replication initiation protein [Flammeovirga]NLR93284.1 replication initiation protein [Flammeovirga agarivorans]